MINFQTAAHFSKAGRAARLDLWDLRHCAGHKSGREYKRSSAKGERAWARQDLRTTLALG